MSKNDFSCRNEEKPSTLSSVSVARKILGNTVAQIAGKAVTAVLAVISIKLVTQLLGVAGYGQYTAVYEYLTFFAIAADLGIYTIAVREMAADEKRTDEILGNMVALRLVLSIIAMTVAVIVAHFIPKYADSMIAGGTAIVAWTTLLNLVSSMMSTVLQVRLRMGLYAVATIFSKIAAVGAIAWVAYVMNHDSQQQLFFAVLWAGVFGNLFLFGFTALFSRNFASICLRFDLGFWKKMLKIALPYGIALILSTIYFRLNVFLLSLMKGPEEVGIYGVAMRVLENISVITFFFMNAVLPVMAKAWKEDRKKVNVIVSHSFDFLMAMSLPILVGIGLLAKPIIALISAPEFVSGVVHPYGSDIAMSILMVALVFSFLSSLFGYTLVALEQQKMLLVGNGIGVAINLVGNLMFIPEYGFRGAAMSSVVAEAMIALSLYLIVRQKLMLRLSLTRFAKALFSALIMGAVILVIQPFMAHLLSEKFALFVTIPVASLVYGATLWLSGGVTKEQLSLLRKPKDGVVVEEEMMNG